MNKFISELTDEEVFAELMKRCDIEPYTHRCNQTWYHEISNDIINVDFGFDYHGKFKEFVVSK